MEGCFVEIQHTGSHDRFKLQIAAVESYSRALSNETAAIVSR